MRDPVDVLLSDGSTVRIRPIEPSDAEAIVAMHGRFSERTRYMRYFSPYPRIPARDLDRFVNVDHRDREAIVVLHGRPDGSAEIIAVGRYERLGPQAPDAEVAFVVADAFQGRGIGSVLLEHLAASAEPAGITRFVAEVLPENGAMLRVFADAGYQVNREYADGVVHLTFPIAPTDRSRQVQADRERRTEARSVARLLRPRGIAVYGASRSGSGVGSALVRHISESYAQRPHLIRPGASLSAVDEDVDLAVVAVPPSAVPAVVQDCAGRVAGLLVVTDLDQTQRRELVRTARATGMRVIGPGSLGVAAHGLNATLSPQLPPPGRAALFCQSGTLGLLLMAEADRRGLGVSSFVSVGQRGDVSGNDLLQYWAGDPDTDVILMYLETFGNPRKFARIAREVGRQKPIVVLSGRTGLGSTLDPSAMQALREHSGVIQVDTVAELVDVGLLLTGAPMPSGRRVGIVGNAAPLASLAGSAVVSAGLAVGPVATVGPSAGEDEFTAALGRALTAEETDSLLVVVSPPLPTGAMTLSDSGATPYAQAIADAAAGSEKPLVTTFLYGSAPDSVPSYPSIEEAVRALARVSRRAMWLRESEGVLPPSPVPAPPLVVSTVEEALAAYGIEVVPNLRAQGIDDVLAAFTKLGGVPVALKVVERPHRIDLGAVRLDVDDEAQLRRAYQDLEGLFGAGVEIFVQPMVAPGVACIVELVDDPAFGPVVGFGLGGVVADLVGDRAWRAAPLTDRDAFDLVRTPRAADLLTGAAGGAPVRVADLEDLLLRVGHLADEVPHVRRLTLNPVLARPDGYAVLQAWGVIEEPQPRPDTGPRLLPPAR
ncbi:acyl-CoA synthetase (NDP forming)/RimJ/RimL family protein N-acetyltransferase [Hamadaea flava]|uniref:GNAT family N-acetyltransferase n=1 Tax=Hamadaea flava TaxID=1742688 RepID=A0ABV8LJA0_9ACTN|nr:GNAT family N-acetyltransferase [Hamadaea flava]MCP2324789.1 acyl-CoA synthetase (NDP forming)/RimJ/RimL family protein N-acetyltransferase [Hamadaea flava]